MTMAGASPSANQDELREMLDRILVQTQKTNGRVTDLEKMTGNQQTTVDDLHRVVFGDHRPGRETEGLLKQSILAQSMLDEWAHMKLWLQRLTVALVAATASGVVNLIFN